MGLAVGIRDRANVQALDTEAESGKQPRRQMMEQQRGAIGVLGQCQLCILNASNLCAELNVLPRTDIEFFSSLAAYSMRATCVSTRNSILDEGPNPVVHPPRLADSTENCEEPRNGSQQCGQAQMSRGGRCIAALAACPRQALRTDRYALALALLISKVDRKLL